MAGANEILPRAFGPYTLLKKLGQGGMAEVLLARQEGIEGTSRLVAIKRVHPSLSADDEFVTMFRDELRIVQHLNHPNIGHALDVGKVEGCHYIALEYVQGRDLSQILRAVEGPGGRMPPEVAVEIGRQVCAALDHAHRRTDGAGRPLNIVHRDVSPDNVILTFDGTAKLMDFGIAVAENRVSRTRAGLVKGKPPYMAPELILGNGIDGRADVFALGALLYRACCGVHPFSASSAEKIFRRVLKEDPVAPGRLVPDFPPELSAVILKALAKDSALRYPDARAMSDALDQVVVRNGYLMTPRRLADWLADRFPFAAEARQRAGALLLDTDAAATASYLSAALLVDLDDDETTQSGEPPRAEPSPVDARLEAPPYGQTEERTVPDRQTVLDRRAPAPDVTPLSKPAGTPAPARAAPPAPARAGTPAPARAAPPAPARAAPPAPARAGTPAPARAGPFARSMGLADRWRRLPAGFRRPPALMLYGALLATVVILSGLGVRACL